MTDDHFPPEPMTGMDEGAVALMELWQSYIRAGFSEWQATYYVGQLLAAPTWAKP